ncbi:hypothetical protein [Marinobacter salarius]|uniref:hypothetical protein n=1 Tax=Marinobacter salarius TaxID=1420917 RepID=UPI0025A4BC47|nr:hypothetical protein [Marinobacter salarius]MDM8181278.1 hypothetical protein [Marinobacter salarius]|tara:strand:+ start:798 stop:968 length:171 start_codon:yes stop_codon:yes gene_type:complete
MTKLYKELKPLFMVASAAWVLGFFGMLGAHQGAKLTGVVLAIAYEESPSKEISDDE